METINLLVFPIDIDASHQTIKQASDLGIRVIGASSESRQANVEGVSNTIHLPYITDDNFEQALAKAIDEHNIHHAFTPHEGVWEKLNTLGTSKPEVFNYKLVGSHPYTAQWLKYLPSYQWAENFIANDTSKNIAAIETSESVSQVQYAGLHYHFVRTPGQTSEEKLAALCSIFNLTPKGDIVEIGSLYGKSALALGWLAQMHSTGNVICVDPWDMDLIEDQGESANILNKQYETIDLNKIFKGFLINTSPLNNIGYIKNTSQHAIEEYGQAAQESYLKCNDHRSVSVQGKVALLHIDGNHRYDHVCKDIQYWEPHVVAGGWILIDDYLWAFGDGPQRAGDELLSTNKFDLAFCSSDTLFLRKRKQMK